MFVANAAAKLSCVYNSSMFWASTYMGRARDSGGNKVCSDPTIEISTKVGTPRGPAFPEGRLCLVQRMYPISSNLKPL